VTAAVESDGWAEEERVDERAGVDGSGFELHDDRMIDPDDAEFHDDPCAQWLAPVDDDPE
jgi:hypothetical protein